MNLNALKAQAVKMELIHPTAGATGITLTLVGMDSGAVRGKYKAMQRELTENPKLSDDMDFAERMGAEIAAACVVGWSDEEAFGVYTPEKALEVMSMPELSWMKEQTEEFVKTRSNFFPKQLSS